MAAPAVGAPRRGLKPLMGYAAPVGGGYAAPVGGAPGVAPTAVVVYAACAAGAPGVSTLPAMLRRHSASMVTVAALGFRLRTRRNRRRGRMGRQAKLQVARDYSSGTAAAGPGDTDPFAEVYPPHLRSNLVARGLKAGTFAQGELRMARNTCFFASVLCGKEEFVVSGSRAINRAIDGDTVVVERLDATKAAEYESTAKRLRHRVGSGKSISEAEDVEQALAQSVSFSGKISGRVVSIVKRNKKHLTGSLQPRDEEGRFPELKEGDCIFVPSDRRFPYALVTPPDGEDGNLEGKRVVVTIAVWDRFSEYPRARWFSTLGEAGDVDVETAMILAEHNVKDEPFTEEVLACLPPENFKPTEEDIRSRQDFRDICVFSIDPPGCEDIDDALSCEVLENGNFRIGVHIADVTHFVHDGSAIDKEAADRGTSVYMVDRRVDMLPKLLTTDICSLRADGDRLTFSAVFELTAEAKIVKKSFCKSVIRSCAQLSYKEAQERLDGAESDTSEITQAICHLNKLAVILRQERFHNGAVELESEEITFETDPETQNPTGMFRYVPYQTCKLIEEFMLLANRSVAEHIERAFHKSSVLRQHSPPKEQMMDSLVKLLECHGVKDFSYITNRALNESLNKVEKPNDPFFNKLVRIMVTRCMNEAKYICTGLCNPVEYLHFGLAMPRYTHFTSPIRRYADCLVHRFLASSLGIEPLPTELASGLTVSTKAEHLNLKHRMARWSSQASVSLHVYLYFKGAGKTLAEGVVMCIKKAGMQVAVEDYGAEGLIEMSSLEWLSIPEQQSIYGRPRSKFEGMSISIFDRVKVSIEADTEDTSRNLRMTFLGFSTPSRKEPLTTEVSETEPTYH